MVKQYLHCHTMELSQPLTGQDPTKCLCNGANYLVCEPEEGVLSDGDIGPTDSVDVSDADQVSQVLLDNGTVGLVFGSGSHGIPLVDLSQVAYVDVYTLTIPSAKMGSPYH